MAQDRGRNRKLTVTVEVGHGDKLNSQHPAQIEGEPPVEEILLTPRRKRDRNTKWTWARSGGGSGK
ncbi:hypothetical protein DFR70_12337 [Nocardia tenerifensis]|uniref:Uncharacterized protein n=1 Tax=Nocardia tenerifensis TaxID=228006 RepID=A0A318JT34_9NOCA|nr:hypothetical protein DFR70_12337 [Nocardia tenerifensis]